ncbi:MAG: hypothetical protein EON60_03900 [Alphaproteobacteria bacterium]|nr:MAG: hypothetical protein EON60_03900 [Alphaproteobacteria bacterium]
MIFRNVLCLTLTLATLTGLAHAQERAAVGAAETQMTWSSLRALIDGANAKSDAVDARIDQIVACNKKQMTYSPGTTADGCVANPDVLNMVTCGDSGKIYDKSKKACIDPSTEVTPKLLWLPNDVFVDGKSKDYDDCPRMYSNCSTVNQRCKVEYTGGECLRWRTTSHNSFGTDVCEETRPFKTKLATCLRTN